MPRSRSRWAFPGLSFSPGAKLALAVLIASGLAAATRSFAYFALTPALIWRGWVWQLVTYCFLDNQPLNVLIDAFVLWSLGQAIQYSWGTRRMLGYSVGTAIASGVLTVLLSLALPILRVQQPFLGASTLITGLWLAYGLALGRTQTNFFGIPITGNGLAWIGVAFVALSAAFNSIWAVFPDIFAIVISVALFRLEAPRTLWLRFGNWRLQRKLRGRARHLRVIAKDRNTPSDSDRYLH